MPSRFISRGSPIRYLLGDEDLCVRNLRGADVAGQHHCAVVIELGEHICQIAVEVREQADIADNQHKEIRSTVNPIPVEESKLLLQRPLIIISDLLLFHMLAEHLP